MSHVLNYILRSNDIVVKWKKFGIWIELILRILNEKVQYEVRDPALKNVSFTSIELSKDLSVAKIYFSHIKLKTDPHMILKGLQRANGFLRTKISKNIDMRIVPELHFFHDDSIVRGIEITKLIDSLDNQSKTYK